MPDPQPNAFATGRNPERGVVAVNQGLLDLLSPEEVEGVIAHLFSTHPPTGDRVAALRALVSGPFLVWPVGSPVPPR